ncbi:MAG: hypothetical protein JWM42_3202, partial [Burkholderia sp.]|nr:hypothetical protein [Burkholderia sp.]
MHRQARRHFSPPIACNTQYVRTEARRYRAYRTRVIRRGGAAPLPVDPHHYRNDERLQGVASLRSPEAHLRRLLLTPVKGVHKGENLQGAAMAGRGVACDDIEAGGPARFGGTVFPKEVEAVR